MNRTALAAMLLVAVAVFATGCSDDDDDGTGGTGGSGATGGSGGAGASGGAGGDASGGSGGTGGAGAANGGAGGQGGSGGDPGAGGTGGGAGASAECNACVGDLYTNNRTCAANIAPCDDDAACNAWKDCNEGCFASDDSLDCYDGCDTAFPHDTALSDPLETCTCEACGDLCVNACAG